MYGFFYCRVSGSRVKLHKERRLSSFFEKKVTKLTKALTSVQSTIDRDEYELSLAAQRYNGFSCLLGVSTCACMPKERESSTRVRARVRERVRVTT
jgi:hypothetical protein